MENTIIQKYKDRFQSVLNEPIVKKILESEEFYFEKAIDKYNEYIDLEVEESVINNLINKTKEKPFSYKKLLNQYSMESIEGKTLKIIGELISYIDKNAAMKNILNEYDDKRTMALAFVRQNVWVQYLLNYKLENKLENLTEIVQNALKYLQSPSKEITVFKEDHRNAILDTFFNGNYESLFEDMRSIGIKSKNPMNDGCLYSVLFYQKEIREIWDISANVDETDERRIWAYAPGENGHKWDEFREQGIMAIGWDEIGDLRDYKTKKNIADHLNEIYESEGKRTNDSLALWQFCKEVQVGDRIFAKAGSKTLLGVGEVISDYKYDSDRDEYKHVRKVQWTKTGHWVLEEKFAIKTLTDITAYEEFCNKIDRLINEEETVDDEETWEIYSKQDFLSDVFISEEQYDTITTLLKRKKNIILQGAPGVGKTYAAKRLAYSIIGEKNEKCIKLVQFHQSYSYEDFIMGYRPDDTGFSIKYGSFYKFCKQAEENPDHDYFFIIDEINRGNLSKIFGELLMLIEADKRGERMILTYEDTEFHVPENIYIIGMMNTADRSLAIIDYALRRRFCFVELSPAFETESFKEYLLNNQVEESLVDKIVSRLSYLNRQIEEDVTLGAGFRIGHSYFCDFNSLDDKWYENIIKYEIAPLLEEYWFDDLDKAKEHIEELLR